MSSIAIRRLEGEVLTLKEMVRVVGRAHPLAGDRFDRLVAAGLSIEEILELVRGDRSELAGRRDYLVAIDGHPILEANWRKVRVKPGVTVSIVPRLAGGAAGNIWKTVLTAVVVVAAFIAAPYLAPGIVSGLAAIGITTTVATATAIASAGLMLAGSLALNALFPVARSSLPEAAGSSFHSIQGAQNSANPDGAVPVVLGRHRQSPFYAARPYTEVVGSDQFLRLLFCCGYGPLAIEDLRIGETPISAFQDVEVEIRQGFQGDAPVTLYPSSVDEVALSIELDAPITGYFIYSPGPYSTQITAAETDFFSADFTAVEGVYGTDKDGDEMHFSISIEMEYRPVASGGTWLSAGIFNLSRSLDPTRIGFGASVARGQYEVRARRLTGRGVPQYTRDKVVWTALRSYKSQAPIAFPKPLALIAMRIKATDQFSGVINTLNCITTSLVKAYSGAGSSWAVNAASQNPADLFRHVLQGPANARPVADALLDLESLQAWWSYCDDEGFEFNQVVAGASSVYEKLTEICAAGRARPTFINGKWGVVWDRPDDSIVQHFTPRNSWGFQGQRVYAQQPHGWRVKFINEENGFSQDERRVFDDGYNESNATLFEKIEFPGVTSPDLIYRHGRFHIAQSRLRPEKFSLSVGWEHLICTTGDRVRITHDVMLVGLASGRVKSVVGQVVTFDEQVTIVDGKTYAMNFRVADNARIIDRAVDETPAGDYTALKLLGDLSDISEGDLFGFGETERAAGVYRVQGIAHQKDLVASLALVDDAPEVSTADQGAIPPYQPNITIPPDPFTLPPRDLRYYENIDGQGATARALVHLFWQVPRFGNIAAFEIQLQDNDSGGPWTTAGSVAPPSTAIDVPITRAGVFSFRVRCLFRDGTSSTWANLLNLSLLALSAVPGNVTNLHQKSIDGQTVLDWSVAEDRRLVNFEVRKGTSWGTSLVVGDVVAQPPWPTTGDGTYHVRAYVLSPFGARIYSTATASITIAASIISRNIILSNDEQVTGWTSKLQGGVIDGSFIRTDVGRVISEAWAQDIVDQLVLSGEHIAIYVSDTIVDIGRAAECRFWTEFDAVGILQGDDFLALPDVLASDDVLGTSPTQFVRAFPIWRFAVDGSIDVFSPDDVFGSADVFSAGVVWKDWVAIASGTRVERFFQPGIVLITDREDTNATATKFRWFVDVPDRTDDYTELEVPDTGLDVTFYFGGYNSAPAPGAPALPFSGGPNGAIVPHVQRAIVDGTNGDEVKITNLTAAGCRVHVVNAGNNVARSGVNLLVRGY